MGSGYPGGVPRQFAAFFQLSIPAAPPFQTAGSISMAVGLTSDVIKLGLISLVIELYLLMKPFWLQSPMFDMRRFPSGSMTMSEGKLRPPLEPAIRLPTAVPLLLN